MTQPVRLFGIPLFPLGRDQARGTLAAFLRESKGSGRKVYTPNATILWQSRKDLSLSSLLRRADLLLPDGAGVILASRLCGTPLPRRITGIDTAEWLLRYGAKRGYSFFFLGGKRGVAERAAKRWQTRLPALRIVGTHHGYFDKNGKENDRVLREIQAAKPDILFVCLGFPQQERWIDRHAASLPSVRLLMGLGGSLDVWSGEVKRAPVPMQRLGLEWLYRTVREPKRWKRIYTLPAFLWCAGVRGRRRGCGGCGGRGRFLKKAPQKLL